MTALTTFPRFDLNTFFKDFGVGFDRELKLFEDLGKNYGSFVKNSFPHYNIKKDGENKYLLELAVAGFGKQNLSIDVEGNTLSISGNIEAENNPDNYLVKGIAERSFTRQFKIADSVKVNNASLVNGILKIWLEGLVPQKQIQKVEINEEAE